MKRSLLTVAAVLAATPAFAASSSSDFSPLGALFGLGIMLACYFFPSIVAATREHHNALSIFLLNLFLGWTGIGWLGALIWSASAVVRRNADGQIG